MRRVAGPLLDDAGALDDGDEVLGAVDFAHEAGPELRGGQGGGVGGVDGVGGGGGDDCHSLFLYSLGGAGAGWYFRQKSRAVRFVAGGAFGFSAWTSSGWLGY